MLVTACDMHGIVQECSSLHVICTGLYRNARHCMWDALECQSDCMQAWECTGMLVTACGMHGNAQEYLSLRVGLK
jgi:hypothetical protein